jgi:hypothetical protein
LGGTLRLTPWANSLRFNGVAADDKTYIPLELLEEEALSFRARGIGSYLYMFPHDGPPTVAQVVADAKEGRDAVLSAVRMLVAAGFVEHVHVKAPIPPSLRMAVLRRDGFRCVICGAPEDLMADHVVPELHGGEATSDNLQTLCRPCNSAKGSDPE